MNLAGSAWTCISTRLPRVAAQRCIEGALLAGMWLLAGTPALADSMRCGARLVSTGDLAAEVLGTCGTPVYRDTWSYPAPYTGEYVSDVEEWYYNFGPSQLLRILRFRNGALDAIDTDGYGFTAANGAVPTARCTPSDFVAGVSKFRLLLRCGEPATREAYSVLRPWRDPHTHRLRDDLLVPVYHERWVYNLGTTYLLQIVTLDNGRIADVISGSRGTDPQP